MKCMHCLDTGMLFQHDPEDEQYSLPMACPYCTTYEDNQRASVETIGRTKRATDQNDV